MNAIAQLLLLISFNPDSIKSILVQQELMDSRENTWSSITYFNIDKLINDIKDRQEEIGANAPHLSDLDYFPTHNEVSAYLLKINNKISEADLMFKYYKASGDNHYKAIAYDDVVKQLTKEYIVYSTALTALQPMYWVQYRRKALREFKEIVGKERYECFRFYNVCY